MKKLVCSNPWCKAHFTPLERDIKIIEGKQVYPRQCKKCKSFDEELSSGVSWEEKTYEGDPWSGSQNIKYNITKYN